MSSFTDIIIPAVIVGVLITLIFGVQVTMLDSSVENRVTRDLQGMADTGVRVMHEHLRELREIELINDSVLVYINTDDNFVHMFRDDRELKVITLSPAADTIAAIPYALRLSDLNFSLHNIGTMDQALLRIQVSTVSTPQEEVGERQHRHRAFAHKDIYLRNLHLNSN